MIDFDSLTDEQLFDVSRDLANAHLKRAAQYCSFVGEIPKLTFTDHEYFDAHASENEIFISKRTFFELLSFDRFCFKDEFQRYKNFIFAPDSGTLTALLFIVGHEFFHIARGHHQVLKEAPNSHFGIEYDADCMSLRFLRAMMELGYDPHDMLPGAIPAQKDDWDIVVVFGLFWVIRNLIGDELHESHDVETHPSWHTRLVYIADELSRWDDLRNKLLATKEVYIRNHKRLVELVLWCDKKYCESRNMNDSSLRAFFADPGEVTASLDKVKDCFANIEPVIRRLQRTEHRKPAISPGSPIS